MSDPRPPIDLRDATVREFLYLCFDCPAVAKRLLDLASVAIGASEINQLSRALNAPCVATAAKLAFDSVVDAHLKETWAVTLRAVEESRDAAARALLDAAVPDDAAKN